MAHVNGAYTTYFNVKRHLCHRYSGRKLREIGAEFGGVTESAVTQASRRLAEALKGNESLCQSVDELKRDLGLSKV